MLSRDGRFVMVFNGEVYNFAEVKKTLVARGHAFEGTGDSEVILASFQEWGVHAVDHFVGMFAIGLWDNTDRTLHLFRDRIGVKPLHYGWDGKVLWFGSELKAIREFRHWQPRLNQTALGEYLQYGYISSLRTIYEGVHKLPPGCRLEFGPGSREPVVSRYWSLHERSSQPLGGDDGAIEEELESLLTQSFQYRLVSDVPVGVFLSGGVDSSLVTAVLSAHATQPLRTFTIGFAEDNRDESAWAKRVANHLGTQHTEYILGVREALEIARNWGPLFDEPFGDASGIPTLLVSRLARAEVKVALSADGGDELFAGYSVYDDVLARLDTLSRVPSWLKSASVRPLAMANVNSMDAALARMGSGAATRGQITRRILRARALMPGSAARVFDAAISYFLPEEVAALLGDYQNPRALADAYAGGPSEQMCRWDFDNYLPEDVLTKVDRTTMAVSLEGREPMLDHRLAEFAFRMPAHLRRGELGPKHALKKILYRRVPRELVDRPKQGFAIPLEQWLHKDLRALVDDSLHEERVRKAGIFDPRMVSALVKRFYAGDTRVAQQVWFLLAFEQWRETWGSGVSR